MTSTFNLKKGGCGNGAVIYWMSRDQRINDNRALAYAQLIALEKKKPLEIIFCLAENFLGATLRQFAFMLRGLDELSQKAKTLNINFHLLKGDIPEAISNYANLIDADSLIVDFDPLRIKRKWKKDTAQRLDCPMIEVDAHNLVPCRIASDKEEFAAYTIRPKIKKLMSEFIGKTPQIIKHPFGEPQHSVVLDYDLSIYNNEVTISAKYEPGETAAINALRKFISNRANNYADKRNEPSLNFQSGLSPYIHFGQISAERIYTEINNSDINTESKDAFIEELTIRKELADNFCFYNANYDNFSGFKKWAQESLNFHREDVRNYIYNLEQFEFANTHDEYWNAAQTEMIKTGKMHGYMRMYWAKKILEWTEHPEQAMDIAIYLNDKYSIDGRDPNGYAGIAWSIGGIHDRAWFDRPVYGKIRYMNDNGLKKKCDIERYVENISEL